MVMEYKREKGFRKVSEVFREVPDSPGKFRKCSGRYWKGPGSSGRSGRFRNIPEGPEGSGISWKVPEGSLVGCTYPLRG